MSTEFINEEDLKPTKFGNMRFRNKGYMVINTKTVGLYFTIFLILSSFSLIIYLM
jgi:hypothetical protein